jgi:hypothetical protein
LPSAPLEAAVRPHAVNGVATAEVFGMEAPEREAYESLARELVTFTEGASS